MISGTEKNLPQPLLRAFETRRVIDANGKEIALESNVDLSEAAAVLRALPMSTRIFKIEARFPWNGLAQPNLAVLEKTGRDERGWRFQREF